MSIILDGKTFAKKIRQDLKSKADELKAQGILPKLAVIMVGNDNASKVYVKNKSLACQEVGIDYEEYLLDENISQKELLNLIKNLNSKKDIHGILLQSPIPKNLNIDEAFRAIDPEKDIDGFNPYNVGLLQLGDECFSPCTPAGIIELLKEYNIEIAGKHAVVIGRSDIVGKPMANLLLNNNATVTICHSKTKKLAEITKQADILIAAIGKLKFVTEDMVKENAVVIDVGMNRDENGNLFGDVDFENIKDKVSYITPVPGGVGPMTIAILMKNVIKAAQKTIDK